MRHEFRNKVVRATGLPTYIATRGLTLDYSLYNITF